MKNQVQLITYIDRLGRGGIADLKELIKGPLKNLFGGIHILPFYYPIDGADAGFDPIDHTAVDSVLGTWEDIKELGKHVDLMTDFIVNHVSTESAQFQDFLINGEGSEYSGLFLTMNSVFPAGATQEQLLNIYRPRPGLPFSVVSRKDGVKEIVWTTFTEKQIDIDVKSPAGQRYLDEILNTFYQNGIKMIRLDAAGYAIKKADTNCFMIPETFDFLNDLTKKANGLGIEVLVEIHSYYLTQIKIAEQVDLVYDFALPALILHTIFSQNSRQLKKWFNISPRNAITVLDTHDGIGVLDVGADPDDPETEGLLNPGEIENLIKTIHSNSRQQSAHATGYAASNLDIYQVNCTYYDALGRDDKTYLIARLMQFFAPGIPQVYYVGLLAGENDMELLNRTKVGRDINRHYYSKNEIEEKVKTSVVDSLFKLIRFRNTHPAFNGEFVIEYTEDTELLMFWKNGQELAELHINLNNMSFALNYSESSSGKHRQQTVNELQDL